MNLMENAELRNFAKVMAESQRAINTAQHDINFLNLARKHHEINNANIGMDLSALDNQLVDAQNRIIAASTNFVFAKMQLVDFVAGLSLEYAKGS